MSNENNEVENKVRKIKLYTKAGDKGNTVLYDSKGYSKSDSVFDLLGDLDELSAHIGMLRSMMNFCTNIKNEIAYYTKDSNGYPCDQEFKGYYYPEILDFLKTIQSKLLDIGSAIAICKKEYTAITEEDIKTIEGEIDKLEEENTPLKVFILPGVFLPDAQAHICRAVARRVEREFVRYGNTDVGGWGDNMRMYMSGKMGNYSEILKYLNRLSDYFFALARNLSGCKENERIAV